MNAREREVMDALAAQLRDVIGAFGVPPSKEDLAALAAYDALVAQDSSEWPECSGDPSSCPENEGYGCCKPNPHDSSEGSGKAMEDCGCYAETNYKNGIDDTVLHRCAKHANGEQEQRNAGDDARDAAIRELIEASHPIANYQWPSEKEWERFRAAQGVVAAQQRQGERT